MSSPNLYTLSNEVHVLDTNYFELTSIDNGLAENRVIAENAVFKGKNCIKVKPLPNMPDLGYDPPNLVFLPEIVFQPLHKGLKGLYLLAAHQLPCDLRDARVKRHTDKQRQ